jgi:hypothetical protein
MTLGADGNVWFTERVANKIGMITPAGAITEYDIPTAGSAPFLIAAGPNSTIWFSESGANKLGVLSGIIAPAPGPSTPGAPTTGFGVFHEKPLQTITIFGIIAVGIASLAVMTRRLAKRRQ